MAAVPRLMLVTDASRSRLPLLALAAEAVAGGVDAIYVRDVQLPSDDLARLVRSLRSVIGSRATIFVNDIALASAAGTSLHLRERDPAPSDARSHLAPGALIGRSVHSAQEAAASIGMDYLLAGHVYSSASKPGRPPLGLAGFAEIATAAPCPILAVGGITADRVLDVIRAGAHGVAVIGAIVATEEPHVAAATLRAALGCALHETRETLHHA
jgi:thiamine-phosphate diphosphorylase